MKNSKIDSILNSIIKQAEAESSTIQSPKNKKRSFEVVIGVVPENLQELWSFKIGIDKKEKEFMLNLRRLGKKPDFDDLLKISEFKMLKEISINFFWHEIHKIFIRQSIDFNLGISEKYQLVTWSDVDAEQWKLNRMKKKIEKISNLFSDEEEEM